jgi:2-polyprenyl-6-methoxyphenol hydroxylase-like FAD-dependent oxidoreductase
VRGDSCNTSHGRRNTYFEGFFTWAAGLFEAIQNSETRKLILPPAVNRVQDRETAHMRRRVIVSGAGIAGLALAHWLDRLGIETLVLERARRVEPLGHYIALKGNGVEMIRRMGLLAACESRAAPLETGCFYNLKGRRLRCENQAALSKALGGYILFRRSDLHTVLYDLVRDRVQVRFATELTDVQMTHEQVVVRLNDGQSEEADLLVGADGIHSLTRQLLFGDTFERPLGGYYVAFTIDQRHGMSRTGRTYLGTGAMVSLLPVSEDSVSGVIYLGASADRPPHHDALAMRAYLLSACSAFPAEVCSVISSLTADDFVFSDAITQVEMPTVVRGRAVLVGDAAHCPTFLSGMGSSLALQDAHVLAGCIGRAGDDLPSALAGYEQTVRPIAERYRDSARSMHRMLLGPDRWKAAIRNLALQLAPARLFERGVRRFYDAERPLADVPAAVPAAST